MIEPTRCGPRPATAIQIAVQGNARRSGSGRTPTGVRRDRTPDGGAVAPLPDGGRLRDASRAAAARGATCGLGHTTRPSGSRMRDSLTAGYLLTPRDRSWETSQHQGQGRPTASCLYGERHDPHSRQRHRHRRGRPDRLRAALPHRLRPPARRGRAGQAAPPGDPAGR